MHIPPGTPFRPNGLGAPHYDPALGDMVTEPKKSRWNDPLEMDGLLGVAGMMTLLVMTGIIPENSLRLAPVRSRKRKAMKLFCLRTLRLELECQNSSAILHDINGISPYRGQPQPTMYTVTYSRLTKYSNPARTMLNPRTPKSQCFSARVSKSDVRGLIFFVHWG